MKTITEYQKDLAMYLSFYEQIRRTTPSPKTVALAERAFYNCLALASSLSFGHSEDFSKSSSLCFSFLKISEKLMYLTGLNEAPDETPFIIAAIRWNACDSLSMVARNEKDIEKGLSEKEYEKQIIEQFLTIEQFNKYEFVKSQVGLPHGDKIDILAKDIISKRPVIMELKRGNKSGHKQLRSYAVGYENPILINLSMENVITKRKDIMYFTYSELGIA